MGAGAVLCALGLAAGPARAAEQRATVAGSEAKAQSSAVRQADAPAANALPFAVTLPLRNRPQLDALIAAVNTPGSAEYGHFLTPEQFKAQFGPTDAQVQQVSDFLRGQGLTVGAVSANNTIVNATGTVAKVGKAFGTTLGTYRDAKLARTYVANDTAVSVPASVSSDVLGVVGLDNHFVRDHPPLPNASPNAGAGPGGGYTPAQLKTGYDIDPLASAGYNGTGQTLGLFELANYNQSNITTYDSQYGLGSPTPTKVNVDGGNTTLGNAEVEVELDIEVMQAVSPKSNIKVFIGPNTDQGVIDTYNAMATSNTTASNSSSWGLCEPNNSTATINAESQVFAQMAAQGQSLFSASGDAAAYDCGTSGQLAVDNPSDDPNVTGTGGTKLTLSASNAWSSEVPWDTNATEGGGGGVSTIFAKPSWQTAPGMPSNCASKRCVPDISADADPATGYSIYSQGSWTSVGGTSAAAPLWAGFTGVYNQYAAANGKPNLGLANPKLYALASATQSFAPYHDITTGHTSTATNWPATSGYDLATGLGSFDGYNIARDLAGQGGGTPTNDFSIADSPTSVSVAAGSSGTSTVSTAVTSGSAQSVALSASGLPSGASAAFSPASVTAGGSSTLTITTTAATAAGTYPVTITGTAASGSHTTSLSLTVTGGSGGSPVQVVANGGFETTAAWTLSSGVRNSSTTQPAHTGTWDAWMDGYGSTHTDTATQSVTIPAGKTSATLAFYLHVATAETTTTTQYDKLTVKVGNTVVKTFSNLNKNTGYALQTIPVGSLAGQTVTLSFSGAEDSSLATSFVIDDVTLTAS